MGPIVKILRWVVLLCGLTAVVRAADRPLATNVAWRTLWEAGDPVRLAIRDEPTRHVLSPPPLPLEPGNTLCLRFRARLHADRPAGWNNYLALTLNDTVLAVKTPGNQPRVLNRRSSFSTSDPQYEEVALVEPRAGLPCLQVFFGPPEPGLDDRLREDREEGYWYLLDISTTTLRGWPVADA